MQTADGRVRDVQLRARQQHTQLMRSALGALTQLRQHLTLTLSGLRGAPLRVFDHTEREIPFRQWRHRWGASGPATSRPAVGGMGEAEGGGRLAPQPPAVTAHAPLRRPSSARAGSTASSHSVKPTKRLQLRSPSELMAAQAPTPRLRPPPGAEHGASTLADGSGAWSARVGVPRPDEVLLLERELARIAPALAAEWTDQLGDPDSRGAAALAACVQNSLDGSTTRGLGGEVAAVESALPHSLHYLLPSRRAETGTDCPSTEAARSECPRPNTPEPVLIHIPAYPTAPSATDAVPLTPRNSPQKLPNERGSRGMAGPAGLVATRVAGAQLPPWRGHTEGME